MPSAAAGRVAQRESTPFPRFAADSRFSAASVTRSTTILDSVLDHFWTLRNRVKTRQITIPEHIRYLSKSPVQSRGRKDRSPRTRRLWQILDRPEPPKGDHRVERAFAPVGRGRVSPHCASDKPYLPLTWIWMVEPIARVT